MQSWCKLKGHSMFSWQRRWERSLEHRALTWLLNKWNSLVVCRHVCDGPSSMWGMVSRNSPPSSLRKGLSLDTELTAYTGWPTSTGDLPALPPLQWDYKRCVLRFWPGCQESKLVLGRACVFLLSYFPRPPKPKVWRREGTKSQQ